MINLLLAMWMYAQPAPAIHARQAHPWHEVCPSATYFYERHHPKPAWAIRMVVACTIGDHVFLKEPPKHKSS